jgi:UDP-GlcNAc:undecaprenyl-phosphate/decaprenyl-phosphate GlcNAc-1-phosphate transferase
MPDYLIYLLFAVLFLLLELVYFHIADRYNIIDHPNERSSHSEVTLRGGGGIFPTAAILFFVFFHFQYPYFLLGLLSIALISFLDDVLTLNNKIRLAVHFISVGLLFFQWGLYDMPWYWLIIGAIFVIGTINAYNFMDGINGLTGLYSLAVILSLKILNSSLHFIDRDFLIIISLSLLIFLFFNFRRKARCFAGDVGSISIAFIILFVLGILILRTEEFIYILFLAVYGADSVLTIFVRVCKKENIFQPHRTHLYQLLSNEKGFSQRMVSVLYAILQLAINFLIMWSVKQDFIYQVIIPSLIFGVLTCTYFLIRHRITRLYDIDPNPSDSLIKKG